MLEFSDLPLAANLALFTLAALVVLGAGWRLAQYAASISTMTGIGHAAMGVFLLAGVTSLPEIAVTATASIAGDIELAVNNLFGSVAMQVALLGVVDFVASRRALTAIVPERTAMRECGMNVVLLTIVACGMVVGDVLFLGAGLWSWACLLGYIACATLLTRGGQAPPAADLGMLAPPRKRGLGLVLVKTVIAAALILVAGFVVARSGEAIATQTGLGSSFVGFVLVAISTSLPEASTALAAARAGHFTMAISDILGTNLINVGLVFMVDALSPGGPPLGEADTFAIFGVLLSIVLTALFLTGLAERRDRALMRMGYDSIAMLAIYAGGLVLLFALR